MRLKCVCKCGLENYTLEDWIAHWKYGEARPHLRPFGNYPKLRAIYLFLFTKLEIVNAN